MHAFDRLTPCAAVLAVVCGGCAPGDPQQADEPAGGAILPNGMERNGVNFNGVNFNGVNFNGVNFNGVGLDGVLLEPLRLSQVHLSGHLLGNVTLAGASLAGTLSSGAHVSGSALTGAEIPGKLSNGAAVTLRIDEVVAGSDPDIELYDVSVREAGLNAPQPLCGAAGVRAIPLSGNWDESAGTQTGGSHIDDPSVFTFACEGYVLAKCALFGYAPWRSVTECAPGGRCASRSLSAFHQACTRLLRADYCGDGTATTRDGTRVDLWDDFGIQDDQEPTWSLEAEWTPQGAACVDETRWPTIEGSGTNVRDYILQHCPARWQPPGCGSDASTFFTANGYNTPLDTRVLLRTRIDQ
jgi:hypothetical protein